MINKKNMYSFISYLLVPLSFFASYLASRFPYTVEVIYSNGLYRFIGQFLSTITGIIPISIGELIFFLVILLSLLKFIQFILKVISKKGSALKLSLAFFKNIIHILGIIYFVFILIWGINYHRIPFSKIANLNTRPSSIQELEMLCSDLIERSNNLRKEITEDRNGVMKIQGGYRNVFSRASLGYSEAAKFIPELGGTYGTPKPVSLSHLMSYTGISGIYFPFTGEANVNVDMPDSYLPSTTSHEMAHQRGFAREDEANYIAYITSTHHPHKDFQYSGTLLALIHSMNAMYRYDKEKHSELKAEYGDGLKRDLINMNNYWKKFKGPVERTSTKMNDMYLKSNMQEDGVHSYGRMVDLLLAEYRANNK